MRSRLLVLIVILVSSVMMGAAQEPSDPALRPTCEDSLQVQIDAVRAGGTVSVRTDCVYRESVTIEQPLVLDGTGGAEIRGSDIWTDWTRVEGGWLSALTLPDWFSHGSCQDGGDRCLWPEQVFLDGEPLRQVATGMMPSGGEFSMTADRHVLIANDPADTVVEVSTRRVWVSVRADDVVVQGFSMRHASNDSQDGAIRINDVARWTVQDNHLSHAHGGMVYFGGTSGGSLLRNDLSFGGQQGFSGSGTDLLIAENVIHHNNTEGFSMGWEAGGAKVTRSNRVVVQGNEFAWNAGPGFWCDIDCHDILIMDNDVHHNDGIGIFFEISDGAEISGNRVWENSRPVGDGWVMQAGIMISSSSNAVVRDNVVAWNGDGIVVMSQCRAHLEDGETCDMTANVNWVSGNQIHNNVIVMDAVRHGHAFAMAWERDIRDDDGERFNYMLTPEAKNSGHSNRYWIPEPPTESGVVFSWGDEHFRELVDFNATPGEENGTLISVEERDRILMEAGIPIVAEPAPIGGDAERTGGRDFPVSELPRRRGDIAY